jgi:hypothetical protein
MENFSLLSRALLSQSSSRVRLLANTLNIDSRSFLACARSHATQWLCLPQACLPAARPYVDSLLILAFERLTLAPIEAYSARLP